MHPRAAQLVRDLRLSPHPEGGHYVEVHRSPAVTSIYFLLAAGEVSRWHRIRSEEIWHFYEGSPLELLQLTPAGADLTRILLGPPAGGAPLEPDGQRPAHCVPADHWQAARSRGAYTLVGCTVAPAFQFADFTLLRDLPDVAEAIGRAHPGVAEFV